MGRDKKNELSDAAIRALKPKEKRYTIGDATRGLHIEVMPSGRKFWRLRYTRDGKQNWFTIGEYPALSAKAARDRVPYLFQRIRDGLPLKDAPDPDMRFETIALEWAKSYEKRQRTARSNQRVMSGLRLHVLPYIGDKDIRKITPQDVLAVLQRLADSGKHTTMTNVRTFVSQVFKYAAARGIAKYDPTYLTHGAIQTPPPKHYPTLRNSADISRLLKAIEEHPNKRVRLAVLFAIYSLSRPGETRSAEWTEIDEERKEWRIAPEKMKKRRPHIVPLSRQLIAIIEAMRPMTEDGRYIFPNSRSGDSPLDKMSMRHFLDAIGFTKEQLSPHGFRSMASTILNENGFNSDWIERQLAHVEGNKVRAAYNYADFLEDRAKMIQWYADYLDELRGKPMDLDLV